ncbi:MAG: hypothetical protein WC549_04655 [Actinomycetota bacterium]
MGQIIGPEDKAKFILNGYSVCEKHLKLWEEGIMTFNENNDPEDYDKLNLLSEK